MILKFATLVALLSIVLGAPISADINRNVIQVPLKKTILTNDDLKRRSMNYEEQLYFSRLRYYTNYTVGGQTQSAILDTGSSDTWLFSVNAWSGGFDPWKSYSYSWKNDDFTAAYGLGYVSVSGTWAEDTVGFAGAEVPHFSFAYLNETSGRFPDHRGIFGMGPRAAENRRPSQPTYVERLKEAGKIRSNTFSIFSGADDSEASLLIGGIDTAKYKSPLYTLPFETNTIYSRYYYSISFEFDGVKYGGGVLDTGTPYILLPRSVADTVAEKYGCIWDEDYQSYLRFTEPSDYSPGLDIIIGGISIVVPVQDLFTVNQGIYRLMISHSLNYGRYSLNILGDPVLKQLYLLFDNDNHGIAFAPIVKTDDCAIVSVGDTIPDSQPAPDQTQAHQKCFYC